MFVLWSNTMSQSFQWYRPFSIHWHLSLHFLKEILCKVGFLWELYDIMVLSDPAKSGLESAWYMDTVPRTKTKTLPLRKFRVCFFFHAVYYSKTNVIPHPVIAAILKVISHILQRWKTTITCQSNSPNTIENYQIELLTANMISGWILL